MTSIIVYFSRAGSNWVDDDVKEISVGNNEILAKYIQNKTGSDIFKIETKRVYTNQYYKATEEAKEEKNNNERPELVAFPKDFEKYDIIYLGYPIWWGTCPMAVFTFLEHYDWTGKTIIPFCSHEGSGIANSVDDIKATCVGANVKDCFEVRGYRCQNLDDDANLKQEISLWLNQTM